MRSLNCGPWLSACSFTWGLMAMTVWFDPGMAWAGVEHGVPACELGDCALQNVPKQRPGQMSGLILKKSVENQPFQGIGPIVTESKLPLPRAKPRHRRIAVTDTLRVSQGSKDTLASREGGNLPKYYRQVSWKDFEASDQAVMATPQLGAKLKGLRRGDVLDAVVEDEIEVWPSRQSPVRAMITKGEYRGAWVSGAAMLDPGRKKIMITLDSLRLIAGGDRTFNLKAEVRSPTGVYGLYGDYHSESAKFFIASIVADTAAGFTDGLIPKTQNLQGNYVEDPSLSNAAKNGVATALNRRAERWVKQEEQAPEWTHLEGYQDVQIYIESDPTEDNS